MPPRQMMDLAKGKVIIHMQHNVTWDGKQSTVWPMSSNINSTLWKETVDHAAKNTNSTDATVKPI